MASRFLNSRTARIARVLFRRVGRHAANPLADWRRRAATLIGAVLLGLAAIVFAGAGDFVQARFAHIAARETLFPLFFTPAIFVAVIWITRNYVNEARGSGIPQVIAASRSPASKASAALVSLRTGLSKTGLTLAMLLGGASVGREGPTVQVSAAIMVWIHRRFGVRMTPGVMIAGGAAGVAAAFNTPLAGIAFAIEELAATYEQRLTVLVMGAVMISGLVSLGLAGDYVYFGHMGEVLSVIHTLEIAPVAGLAGGLLGGGVARLLLAQSRAGPGWARLLRGHPLAAALVCGLIVAAVGIFTNGATWGTGYSTTRALLAGQPVTMWFGPGKLIAAVVTALSGAPGGIFSPSLAVGAGLGQLIAGLFPAVSAAPIILLGMVAYFVGLVRAPFTAVIIVSEASGNHGAILSLFATALIADWVSAAVCPTRLYHGLSEAFLTRAPQSKA